MTTFNRVTSVAEIVLDHPECAKVFHDHRIDFCCRGGLSLTAACAGKGLDEDAVVASLERAIAQRAGSMNGDLRRMSTRELISHVVSRHHAYLDEALPFVERLAEKVARVHGDHNPKLCTLRDAFVELCAVLEPHLREEERVLFPALMAERRDDALVARELAGMHKDHLRVGELLTCIRTLADDFTVPEWACGSYRTLIRELANLEMDTFRHVHLENHVLMPRFAPADDGGPAPDHDGVGRSEVERLRCEHGNIARLLLVLESHLARLHAGEDLDEQLMLDAVSYLTDYVDGIHHAREDLIVELLAEREPLVRAILATLSAQHDAIRAEGAMLRERLESAALDAPVAREDLVRHGFAYTGDLRRNMALEERVVFPLAVVGLSAAEWGAIEAKVAGGVDPLFGGTVEPPYRALFEEIARRVGCDCAYAQAT